MTTVVSNGYFGTAEVLTTGAPERQAYIARMYIHALVLAILMADSAAGAADIVAQPGQATALQEDDIPRHRHGRVRPVVGPAAAWRLHPK